MDGKKLDSFFKSTVSWWHHRILIAAAGIQRQEVTEGGSEAAVDVGKLGSQTEL